MTRAHQQSQQLKRSQSVQHSTSSPCTYPSTISVLPSNTSTNNSISRQQSAPINATITDLCYHRQNQMNSAQADSSLSLPTLPSPPCISLQRRDSVKSDSCQTDSASSRYKTEMCRPFEETGNCRYGSKCQFAHGIQELRSLNRHPRYKTEFCRTFHTTGFCSYGQRCNFIHNEDERRGPQQPSTSTGRPKGLNLNTTVPLKNSTGSLGSAGSLMSSTSVSPAGSIYGDLSPSHTPSYLSDDSASNRLSPTPSFSSDISFPSPTGSNQLIDDLFESGPMSSTLDYNLSFSLINSLNL